MRAEPLHPVQLHQGPHPRLLQLLRKVRGPQGRRIRRPLPLRTGDTCHGLTDHGHKGHGAGCAFRCGEFPCRRGQAEGQDLCPPEGENKGRKGKNRPVGGSKTGAGL